MTEKYFGYYLIVRMLCPSCEALKARIKAKGAPTGLLIINAKMTDGMTLASYTETLENTIPYLIRMHTDSHEVFGRDENGKTEEQRMKEVREALWGTE